jgi:hypothetical protein
MNIDIFETYYEQTDSYFNCLENLKKIRHTKGPGPTTLSVDNTGGGIRYQYGWQVF